MPAVISQQGITNTFPGGSVTHMPAQPQQFPDPRGAMFQLPAQMMAGFSNNFGSLASGLGGLGGALGQMSGQQSSALAGLGNALAQNYGAYGGTIGNIANAASADNVGRYGAMANATQANQLGLGNLWTQAMAQLGGLGNTIANSMGQGQTGYQSALAGMQAANQGAVSQYGQSRMQNLARLGAADAVQNMNFDFGGGGGGGNQFAASGPQGAIASGSYGGGGGGGGGGISGGGADMGTYRDDIMDGSVLSQLAQADMDARERMDRQQDMYRQDYGNLFGSGLSGLLTMGREGTGALREGMGDFYSNMDRNRTNFGEYLDAARQGFGQSSSDIRGVGDRMSRDYGSSLGALTGLASQIGSGMRDANQTGVDFANNFLQRYMPTPEEEYRRANRLGAMRAADRESAMMRSPYVAAYNAYRDRQRAAERRMPVMR